MKILSLTLAIMPALTGCWRNADHSPAPDFSPPKSWSTPPAVHIDANVTYWTKSFGDANLTALVREAWTSSPDL
ncbi:MAG: hypothetical protein HOB63_08190, partial [Opitutae bacterium]|nr:hypothetical protein [Opitutae bacterium]